MFALQHQCPPAPDVARAKPDQILAGDVHCKLQGLVAMGKRTQPMIQLAMANAQRI